MLIIINIVKRLWLFLVVMKKLLDLIMLEYKNKVKI